MPTPDRYFSHRRDGVTGRQAALIWLRKRRHRPLNCGFRTPIY